MTQSTIDQAVNSSTVKVDLTVTISVIIAICAIVSPVIVALINNHHQFKMRKLELDHEKKIKMMEMTYSHVMKLFEEYLGALEGCVKCRTDRTLEAYGVAMGNALMYASHTSRSIMLDIDETIKNSDFYTIEDDVKTHMINNISSTLMLDLEDYKKD